MTLDIVAKHPKQIDDWDNNATVKEKKIIPKHTNIKRIKTRSACGMGGDIAPGRLSVASASPKAFRSKKLGMAVGGAKDTNNFKANIDNGYLPKLDSITYEGQFYNHYFDTGLGGKECKSLFCPSYSSAKRVNNFSNEEEYFLSVGLNSGVDAKDFKRKKLNLVIVLDISGSMSAGFDSYYYDKSGNKVENKEKKSKKR